MYWRTSNLPMVNQTDYERVVIVGCGRVGAQIALEIYNQVPLLIVVDHNRDALNRLDSIEGKFHPVIKDAANVNVLKEVGLENDPSGSKQLLIVVTEGDNRNIMTSLMARDLNANLSIICRITDPKRFELFRNEAGIIFFSSTLLNSNFILEASHLKESVLVNGVPNVLQTPNFGQ